MKIQKNNILSSTPGTIKLLILICISIGMLKIYNGVVVLNIFGFWKASINDIMTPSLNALLLVLIGVVYLFIAKWIYEKQNAGRTMLNLLMLIELVKALWHDSEITILLFLNTSKIEIYTDLMLNIILTTFYIMTLFILSRDEVKSYCFVEQSK